MLCMLSTLDAIVLRGERRTSVVECDWRLSQGYDRHCRLPFSRTVASPDTAEGLIWIERNVC